MDVARAVAHVRSMHAHLVSVSVGRPFDLEVSVDETDTPTTPAERFLQETTWRVQSQNDATRYVETRLKLLYYPVWQIRYRHRGRLYSLAVDGVTGQLLRGTAPQGQALAAGAASAGAGLSALGLGRWLRGLVGRGAEGPAVLLLVMAGAALLWLAWHWFAQEGDVELVSG